MTHPTMTQPTAPIVADSFAEELIASGYRNGRIEAWSRVALILGKHMGDPSATVDELVEELKKEVASLKG
jgi:hypothetical protein